MPAAKKTFDKTSPVRREKMSVSFPDSGCKAAVEMKYAEASHERRVKELKEVEIAAERVATTVESSAARKQPR